MDIIQIYLCQLCIFQWHETRARNSSVLAGYIRGCCNVRMAMDYVCLGDVFVSCMNLKELLTLEPDV